MRRSLVPTLHVGTLACRRRYETGIAGFCGARENEIRGN
jgi:hypothetical protein